MYIRMAQTSVSVPFFACPVQEILGFLCPELMHVFNIA